MAILGKLINKVSAKFNRVNSPELAIFLGQDLAHKIVAEYYSSGMKNQTGNTVDVLSHVGQPEKAFGGWRIGVVGDASRMGDPDETSPKGTISQFLNWYTQQTGVNQFIVKGGVPSRYAWWLLTRKQKEALQQAREAGMFGGASAVAAGRVPYMWGHESGNPNADLDGKHFIQNGLSDWRKDVSSLIDEFYRRA